MKVPFRFWIVCLLVLASGERVWADLSENFDASTAVPAGWIDGGTANDTVSTHYQSAPNCRAIGTGDTLQTSTVDFPTNLSFYVDASLGGNNKTGTVDYSIAGGTWTLLGSFIATSAGSTKTFPLTSSPNLSSSAGVRFRFNSTFNTWYLDNVVIRTGFMAPSNSAPTLSLNPAETNRVVLAGDEVRVVVGAIEADGDEITLSGVGLPAGSTFDPNPRVGTSLVTNTFLWVPATIGSYSMSFFAADKDGTNRVDLVVDVYQIDPTLLIEENFDAATTVPAGWIDGGTGNDSVASHYASPPNCRALGSNDTLKTPAVDFPTNLSFYADASTAGNGKSADVSYRIGSNDWISLGTFVASSSGATVSFSLLDLPDVAASEDVQFRFSSTFMTWYLDDVVIRGQRLTDQPPVLAPIGPQVVALGQELSVAVVATDYDQDEIILSASNLPPGAVFDTVTNAGCVTNYLNYAPAESEAGMVYTSTFFAVDTNGTTEEILTISVFDKLIRFATAGTSVWEGDGTQKVAVVLSRPADVTVEVVATGTATPGPDGDCVLVESNLAFTADGSTTQFLNLAVLDDIHREQVETVILTLTNAVGADIGPVVQHTVDVRDNDAAFFDPFDANPGWSTQGQWAFGPPLGGGGSYEYPDPTSGSTGTNVYGYNLSGNYADNMTTTYYLTTPAIDCTRFRNVRLQFARWLGIEYSFYDQAVIQASLDRSTWVDVWQHSGYTIGDTCWTNMDYDISSFADGQPFVYIRWGLGPTDSSVNYCGWNIDDVALAGEAVSNALFRFASAGYSARETSTVVNVTIERIGLTNVVSEIVFATSNQTATAGADYAMVEETLVFAPGERSQVVSISLLDDTDVEGEETVGLYLNPTATGDLASPAAAVLVLQDDESPGAGLPFFDGFEAGILSADWRPVSTGAGRIELSSEVVAAFEGSGHVSLDSTHYNSYGLNELVLTVNLSGQTNVTLDFQENNYDALREAMPSQFRGSTPADGVAVSGDGLNWLRLCDASSSRYSYTNRTVNLSAFAASNGLALDSNFEIKFQQYDRYPLPTYGRCFDNIQVYDPAQAADVQLTVRESEDPVLPGSNLVYSLLVTNAGPLVVTGLVVSNDFPAGVAFVSAESSQGTWVHEAGTVICNLGDLALGGSALVILTVAVPAETGTITNRASVWGESFDPFRTNNTVTTTTVVDELGGILQMAVDSMTVAEKAGTASIGVVRTGPTYGAISVNYATSDGTAVAGADYTPTTGTLCFASGQTAAALVIPIADDNLDEPTETFSMVISEPGGGSGLGPVLETAVCILDDDGRAEFPLYESFESGSLTNYWRTYSTSAGRIAVTTNNGPHAGAHHLTMDSYPSGTFALNELVLTVDLAGKQGVTLAFWHKQFSDEGNPMSSAFTGHQNSDGVAMSMNGTNWVKAKGLTMSEGSSNTYGYFEVALDPIAAANGLTYTSTFKIKFQQYDNLSIPGDGFAFDEISLFSRPGELRFGQAAYDASETGGVAVVTVERVNGSLGEVTVQFSAADGTATAGSDYAATNGVLTFADGVTTGSFEVALLNDTEDEPVETILLMLSDPVGGVTLVAPSNAILNVSDDDGPGEFVFGADTTAVAENSGGATIAVWRLNGAEGEAAVDYATLDGTASNGLDYVMATGTLVFAAGVTQQEFNVTLLDDAEQEDAETVLLALGNPTGGAVIGEPGTAILSIVDDEDPNYEYYAPANGKEGAELKQALHDIIDDHTVFGYDTLWTILQQTDECPTNASQVQLVYMQIGRDKNNNGGLSGQWNREHTWPQSHGFPDALSPSVPPSVDAHNLKPADVQVNALRGEKDFDNGGAPVAGTPPTCRTTPSTFEPPDASKGDIARMMFYMDVRYAGDKDGEPDLQLVDAIDTSGAQLGKLSTLIQWHFQDPPDDFEKQRNNLIYTHWQGNRNPFIDHPEWVLKIWEYNLAIATLSGAHGSITPANPQVPYHSDQSFEIMPEPYYHIADIRTNGVSLGGSYGTSSYSFAWGPIVSTGTVQAVFAANLTPSHGIPEWWLAAHGITNDFDEAEDADFDGDGVPTWQESVMDTDPLDPDSFLRMEAMELASGPPCWDVVWTNDESPDEVGTSTVCTVLGYVMSWPASTSRVYDVQYRDDLLGDVWLPMDGMTNLVPVSDDLSVTNLFHDGRMRMIRLQVRDP